ncbi:unnamed protein product [Microthlaspi erraticum]|uniref:Cyclic nucleotide-binding domain-containing protein n=1 Tax=Microthlaspi erraticum TaxID=1685480 RepID=A0A6D2KZ60_9BRAS|nr:unnamed protein product [Microthlaspi erraticum]
MLFVCVLALAIDPLFFFIPVIDSHRFCFTVDKNLGATVCVFRTFIDTFYVLHIIFLYITVVVAPRSKVSLRGEVVEHSKAKRKKRFFFYFIVDIVSVLPIPQAVVLAHLTRKQQTAKLVTKEILKWVMFCQYIPRSIRIYPIFKEVTRASGRVVETKWVGATLNLFLYMLPSHVIGALWYLIAIEKKDRCWREACGITPGCNLKNLYCARGGGDNHQFLNTSCPLIDPDQITNSTVFNFGMYIGALKSGVVESRDFPKKFFYCFWWGLRNLSALGQNLETSNSVEEILFATIICVSGLLLFAVLIGNVQKYLQSTTTRVDEMEEKKRDTEKWMSYRILPEYLKERIRRYEDYKWRETRGIEEEALLRSLPKDLRLETKRHLCLKLLKIVPWIDIIDDGWLLEALCDRVKSVFYSANSYIVRQGDPVEEMLIITRGKLISKTESLVNNNYCYLREGDMCGELLFDIMHPHSGSRLPTSTRTVVTLTDVEGFIFLPDDLKFVASHFNHVQIMRFKHMFRQGLETRVAFEWRQWAAFFIQAAWRRHWKRKLDKILSTERENQQTLQGAQLSLGATLHVSRFIAKALQNQRENTSDVFSSPHTLPPKPADLEFSKDEA